MHLCGTCLVTRDDVLLCWYACALSPAGSLFKFPLVVEWSMSSDVM
jgi:hypothetical protein